MPETPSALVDQAASPSCCLAICRTRASPSPAPPSARPCVRKNGSKMRSLSCSGTPAPWSVTLSVALPPCIRTSTSTGGAPCRSALIHRRLSHPRRCNHQASDEGRRGRRSRDGTPEDRGSTLPSFGLGQDVSADAEAAGRQMAFWQKAIRW
jgi:hypothetical protein